MNLDPPQKLILARAADLGVMQMIFRKIWTQVRRMPVSLILVFGMLHLLLLGEGILIFLASFMRWPRKGRWAIRIRKMAIVSGVILCGIALADRFDKLPGTCRRPRLSVAFPCTGYCSPNWTVCGRYFPNSRSKVQNSF